MVEADKCAIIHEWFEIILPMTADGEKTVQDKAMSEINVQECFLSLPKFGNQTQEKSYFMRPILVQF